MNTPAHMIVGMAVFGKPGQKRVTLAAVAGGFVPDLSLFVMVGVSIYLLGIEPAVVFGRLFYSEAWQSVFAIDNSVFLWGAFLALAVWRRWASLTAFAGSGLLHLLFDFLLHNGDARQHFWPVSDWIFNSPLSYWDRNYYGDIVGAVELLGAILLCLWMLFRFRGWFIRGVVVALGAAELVSSHLWHAMF